MEYTASAKIASVEYDVSRDGGSQGSISMDTYLPPNCVVVYGFAKVLETFSAGAGGRLSIGVQGTLGFFILATDYTTFTAGTIVEGRDRIRDMGVPGVISLAIVIGIFTADFTAGRLLYTCYYVELDQ